MPSTMTMPEPLDVAKEMALSLQHVRRVRGVLPLTSSPEDPALYMGLVVWVAATEILPAMAEAVLTAMNLHGTSRVYGSDHSGVCPPVLFVVPAALPKGATVEVQAIFQTIHSPDDEHPRLNASITTRYGSELREESSELSNGRSFTIFWFNQNCEFLSTASDTPISLFQPFQARCNLCVKNRRPMRRSLCEYTTPLA